MLVRFWYGIGSGLDVIGSGLDVIDSDLDIDIVHEALSEIMT